MEQYLKNFKKSMWKIVLLILVVLFIYECNFERNYKKSLKIISADLEIERSKIENAIKDFKEKTGKYPNLYNKENDLSLVISEDGTYNFGMSYGYEKFPEVPGKISDGIKKSNRINAINDKKGGWYYNMKMGRISPNIDIEEK